MVKSKADSPEAYVAELPLERREAISEVRKVVLEICPRVIKKVCSTE